MRTIARQVPLSMGFSKARILGWVAMPSSRGSSWSRDQTPASLMSPALADKSFTTSATWKAQQHLLNINNWNRIEQFVPLRTNRDQAPLDNRHGLLLELGSTYTIEAICLHDITNYFLNLWAYLLKYPSSSRFLQNKWIISSFTYFTNFPYALTGFFWHSV